jgi:hypothetical protein
MKLLSHGGDQHLYKRPLLGGYSIVPQGIVYEQIRILERRMTEYYYNTVNFKIKQQYRFSTPLCFDQV